MNTIGELRHYSDEGELIMQINIPEYIKRSRFDYVINTNKELHENLVLPLRYAYEMKIHDNLIYLFMPKPDPDASELDVRMLVYDSDGELLKHYVFVDPEDEFFLYDFTIGNDNNIYFIDVMNSKILNFLPDVE